MSEALNPNKEDLVRIMCSQDSGTSLRQDYGHESFDKYSPLPLIALVCPILDLTTVSTRGFCTLQASSEGAGRTKKHLQDFLSLIGPQVCMMIVSKALQVCPVT